MVSWVGFSLKQKFDIVPLGTGFPLFLAIGSWTVVWRVYKVKNKIHPKRCCPSTDQKIQYLLNISLKNLSLVCMEWEFSPWFNKKKITHLNNYSVATIAECFHICSIQSLYMRTSWMHRMSFFVQSHHLFKYRIIEMGAYAHDHLPQHIPLNAPSFIPAILHNNLWVKKSRPSPDVVLTWPMQSASSSSSADY